MGKYPATAYGDAGFHLKNARLALERAHAEARTPFEAALARRLYAATLNVSRHVHHAGGIGWDVAKPPLEMRERAA